MSNFLNKLHSNLDTSSLTIQVCFVIVTLILYYLKDLRFKEVPKDVSGMLQG